MACLRYAVCGPGHARQAGVGLRVVRLAHDDRGSRRTLLQHARNALERAAGAETRDPVVEALGEVIEDLDRGRARMDVGVRFVLELAGQKPSMLARQLDRL